MLIKLMKHEFRATGRIMLPLYLVLLVTAVGANFTTRGLLSTQYKLLDVLGALLVMAFVVADVYKRQVVMVKPWGTGRPMLVISARFAPLPPKSSRMFALPSVNR